MERVEVNAEIDLNVMGGVRGSDYVEPGRDAKGNKASDEAKKASLLSWALSFVVRRVSTARDLDDLGNNLQKAKEALDADASAGEVDDLRMAVAHKVSELGGEEVDIKIGVLNGLLNEGKVREAVKFVRDLADKEELKNNDSEEVDKILNLVNEVNSGKDGKQVELKKLVSEGRVEVGKQLVKIEKSTREVDLQSTRASILKETGGEIDEDRQLDGVIKRSKIEIENVKKASLEIIENKKGIRKRDKRQDVDFIENLRNGKYLRVDDNNNAEIDISKLNRKEALLMYGRVSLIRGRYKTEMKKPENEEIDKFMEDWSRELRGHLLRLQEKASNIKGEEAISPPGEKMWEELPSADRAKYVGNLDYMEKFNTPDKMYQEYARNMKMRGESVSKTEAVLQAFKARYPEMSEHLYEQDGRLQWDGKAAEFYEVCRRELDEIKSSVPEERLGQLQFENVAAMYMEMMGVNTKGKPDLQQAKEAVTKTLYMQFALKSLWKSGGNFEQLQRSAGILSREGADTNFFKTMKIREAIRLVDATGKELKIANGEAGFDVNDIMTMSELEAPDGTSWLAYISHNNMTVARERLKEYGIALTKHGIEKARLREEMTQKDCNDWIRRIDSGQYSIEEKQLEWMRDYTHFVMVSSGRAGESLYLFNTVSPEEGGFAYASFPAGQISQKLSPWASLYYAYYGVTKYSGEFVGKLPLPIAGMLSFARGETMSHFLAEKEGEVWMETPEGEILKTGMGANEFFFKNVDNTTIDSEGHTDQENVTTIFTSFMRDMLLDERMGKSWKARGQRAIKVARDRGKQMISEGKHELFVEEMDFNPLEVRMGHEIPGENNEEKFKWIVNNFSYDMLDVETMPSKREGDLFNKYWGYMNELVGKLRDSMNSPSLTGRMEMTEIIESYNSAAVEDFVENYDKILEHIRKPGISLKEGGKWWNLSDYVSGRLTKKTSKGFTYNMASDGEHFTLEDEAKSPWTGWYFGKWPKFSAQQLREGFQDNLVMKKIEIENKIAWGTVTPEEGGKLMREWQKEMYFGPEIEIKGKKLRMGAIPILTPFFLYRGWFIDRMGLNWEDFKTITRKNNEEMWEKFKKIANFSV